MYKSFVLLYHKKATITNEFTKKMKLSEFQTEILNWMREIESQTGRGVTEFQLVRRFDEGIVWGMGYQGVLNEIRRMVKRGILVERGQRFHTAHNGGAR